MKYFDGMWQNRKVLVTGHTGFKGSWLSLWLTMLGASVTGYSLPPPAGPSHFKLLGLEKNITHVEGDIRDYEKVLKAFKKTRPEVVFHLAAQALVRDSYTDPKDTFDTNVGGTVNILEAIRHTPSIKAAVMVTSDKCYENHEWHWGYRENDPMGGSDPYSASKGAAEIVCASYLRSYFQKTDDDPGMGFSTVRAGNVIGGGDWAKDRIIPDCVRSLCGGKSLLIRNPHAIRPWQHVLDPLSGYLMLASRLLSEPDRFSGPWNFGPDDRRYVTVGELAERFVSAWPKSGNRISFSKTKGPKEASLLKLSIEKAVSELHWLPVLDMTTAIDWTLSWYDAWHRDSGSISDLSQGQIEAYMEKAGKKKLPWTGKI